MTIRSPLRQLELDRLRRLRDPSGTLLSVFVTVPPDPAALRELPARLSRLLATARVPGLDDSAGRRARAAVAQVRKIGAMNARDWFGRSIAIVASRDGSVLEELRLPCAPPDRAVFGRRPYIRPLVRAVQRCRPYSVVVLDRRQAWLFVVSGSTVHRVRRLDDEAARAHSYGGVVGGHKDGVAEFLTRLSPPRRDRVAGTFAIDPRTMTPDRVRVRASAAMAEREASRQQRLVTELARWEAAGLAVSGVRRCAESVGSSSADPPGRPW